MKDALDSIQALNQTLDKYHITDYLNLQGPSSPSSCDCSSNTDTTAITFAAAAAAAAAAPTEDNEEDVTSMRSDDEHPIIAQVGPSSESVTSRISSSSSSSSQQQRQPEAEYTSNDVPTLEKDDIMDSEAREMLVEWCFRVTHHFHIQTKIVAYAMNYMDRCCSFYQGKIPKDFVRLIMASSLLLSIKIHHTVKHHPEEQQQSSNQHPSIIKLTPSTTSQLLSQLTEGQYSSFVIARFERVLIRVLGCNLLPPLPFRYLQEYLVVLQNSYAIQHDETRRSKPGYEMTGMKDRTDEDNTNLHFTDVNDEELFIQDISTKAFQLCDVAVSSYYLSVLAKPSIVALAALCNSLAFYAVEETSHTTADNDGVCPMEEEGTNHTKTLLSRKSTATAPQRTCISRHQMFLDTRPLDLLKVIQQHVSMDNHETLLLLQVQDMLWQMACLDDELEQGVLHDNDCHSNNNTTSRRRHYDSDSSERNKSTPHSVMDAPNDSFKKK